MTELRPDPSRLLGYRLAVAEAIQNGSSAEDVAASLGTMAEGKVGNKAGAKDGVKLGAKVGEKAGDKSA